MYYKGTDLSEWYDLKILLTLKESKRWLHFIQGDLIFIFC